MIVILKLKDYSGEYMISLISIISINSSAFRSATGGSERKRTRGYLWTDIQIVPNRVGAGRN